MVLPRCFDSLDSSKLMAYKCALMLGKKEIVGCMCIGGIEVHGIEIFFNLLRPLVPSANMFFGLWSPKCPVAVHGDAL